MNISFWDELKIKYNLNRQAILSWHEKKNVTVLSHKKGYIKYNAFILFFGPLGFLVSSKRKTEPTMFQPKHSAALWGKTAELTWDLNYGAYRPCIYTKRTLTFPLLGRIIHLEL